jgi:hypothetical protein
MSAVEALKVARAAGIHLGIDGDDLVLEASAPPPTYDCRSGTRLRLLKAALDAPSSGGENTRRTTAPHTRQVFGKIVSHVADRVATSQTLGSLFRS